MILKVFLLCGFLLQMIAAQTTVKLLVLTEQNQDAVPQMVATGLKNAEGKHRSLKFDQVPLAVDRENEAESLKQVCQQLSAGVSLILDLTWTGWKGCDEMAEKVGIPYVRGDPTVSSFVQVMDSYLTQRQSTDAALIFQNEQELDQTLYYLIGRSIIRVIVLNGLKEGSPEKLKKMRPSPSYFIIFATTQNMTQLYKQAVDGGLVTRDERWNLIFTDFNDDNFDTSQLNTSAILFTMKSDVCCRLLSVSTGCICPTDFEIIPAYVNQLGLLIGDIASELAGNDVLLSPRVVEDCNIRATGESPRKEFYGVISQTIEKLDALGYYTNEKKVYYLNYFDIYSVNSSTKKKQAEFRDGTIHLEANIKLSSGKRFFRVGTAEGIPWSYKQRDPVTGVLLKDENGADIWDGYCIDLLKMLAKNMDFDYEIVPPDNGAFGSRHSDGTWDGMVGDLAMGETDMVIAPLTMTSEREEVIDFVAPYFDQSGISIVIRKPVRKTSLFKFMTVLRLEVWLSIVGALTVTGIMIWILDKYSPYSAQNNKSMYPYPCREFTLKESFWFALTSFTPQGGGEAPKALSGRTLVAAYWLFVVLMLATFTANLAAFLTVERMKSPVASLEQLARQSRINYTVVANSDTHEYFINMKNAEDVLYGVWKDITLNSSSDQSKYRVWDYPIKEQYGHILQAINQTGPVPNDTVGFQQVVAEEEGKFAFIHDAARIRYEVSRNCNLTEVGEMFAEQPYAIAVQQGSHLQEEISRKILDLQKDRYFETLSGKYWNSSAKGSCPNTDDSEGITLESLGGVFIATLFGLALAMITLAGEIFYYKRKKFNAVSAPAASDNASKKQVTIGNEFRPVIDKTMPRVSYISVFPRNQLY